MLSSLRLRLDSPEYCVYGSGPSRMVARLIPVPTQGIAGLPVALAIRRGDMTLWQEQATLRDGPYTEVVIDLRSLKDDIGCFLLRTGDYALVAEADGQRAEAAFAMDLVTVREMKDVWCMGATLQTAEILDVRYQPRLVTGVRIEEVSFGTRPGPHPLRYNAVAKTLSWDGGEPVSVSPDQAEYLLFDEASEDYVRVRVDYEKLPAADAEETLAVDFGVLPDHRIREVIRQAKAWVEARLNVFVEPRVLATEQEPGELVDEIVEAVDYVRPDSFARWMTIPIPYRPLLAVHRLDGYFNRTKVTSIDRNWITVDQRSGLVQLVPSNQAMVSWLLYGPTFAVYLFSSQTIPEFWHFRVTAGLKDLAEAPRSVVREAIAKKAAWDLLTAAGQAYRAGYSAESTSRDGITHSVSYTSSAVYGIYSATIDEYKEWLKKNVESGVLRRKLIGIEMVVV